ncbi:MAG: LacI family DNA-binding transcriptional regulator [Oscillospiraceae bacterium]|nr:LacI family DNA-binding transcriptional regulator [Oscillospiraceae bacterium]
MVSIKDIASACGVSIATVSKALNGHKDVSESTKATIRDTAKRMGYLPNSQARALKTNRTYNLGVLFVERAQSGLTHSHFAAVLNGFKNRAEAEGYDITFINKRVGNTEMTYYEHCICRNVDGVVIACVDDFEDNGVTELLESSVPTVTIDYKSPNNPAVISDNTSGMKALVEYIYGRGHRKIAYIYGDVSKVTSMRVKSYEETLASLNINVRSDYLLQGRYHDPETTEKLAAELALLDDPPTCIIMPDDFSAIGALTAFEKLGLDVPGDISVAGYDGILLSRFLNPRLTTFEQDTESIGARAAGQLIALIRKEIPADVPEIVVGGRLIEGSSVRSLNR